MKTFNLLFVLSFFVFASCETAEFVDTPNTNELSLVSDTTENRVDDDPIESRFTFTAYINGSYFRAESFESIQTGDQLIFEGEKSGNSIVLQFPADIINGDYTVGASIGLYDSFSAALTVNGQTQQINLGSLTILSHTADMGNIVGNFDFQTADFEVSRGVFKLYY